MATSTEYLEKKVEALEALYLAEKERVEALQLTCDNFKASLRNLTSDLDRFAAHFRNSPYIHPQY